MVFFPGMGGENSLLMMIINVVFLLGFFALLPRIIIMRSLQKIGKTLTSLEDNATATEEMFLQGVAGGTGEELRERMDPMKNMVVSPPTGIDPAGLVDKLEHFLEISDDKMERFVESLSDSELGEKEKANLSMAFKGVYGSHQIFVLIRHFKNLIEDTKNMQLAQMMQMMLPLYEEIAEAQKEATEAFVNGIPVGDSVGPLVVAEFMEEEPEELAEDVVVSEEEFDGETLYVLKSNGPGSRLGKYGDAIEQVMEENDVEKIIFVDAGMRFEGEETGKVVDGAGVLMGGPGVEKFKIEEVAEDHDVPLEGFIVKQSGPQASRPMHSKIYDAVPEAVERVEDEIGGSDGTVLLVGVGNTVGVGNAKESTADIPEKLRPYWEDEEEESTSYFGMMKAFPMGGGGDMYGRGSQNTFEVFRKIVR